jgi:hypothetical protein
MTEFMNKSFSVYQSGDRDYRDRWEATFGKKPNHTGNDEDIVCHTQAECPNGKDRCNMCDRSVPLLECGCTTHAVGCLSR